MADIALSNGVRQNLLSMQSTVDLMSRTQNRLASGKKVNSALDNPTNYFVAAGLDNRANDLSRLLDSMGLGIKTIEAADNGIKAIKKLVETAQGTARQALQAASSTPKFSSAATPASKILLQDLGFADGDALTIKLGKAGDPVPPGLPTGTTMPLEVTVTLDVTASTTVADLSDQVATAVAAEEFQNHISARVTESGRLVIESTTGDQLSITADDVVDGTPSATKGLMAVFGLPTLDADDTTTIPAALNTIRQSLGKQFEDLKQQIDQIIKDTGYNGVNLLNGDTLKVLFNENNTTSIDIQGVVFNSLGLGLAPVIDGASQDTPFQWQSDMEIQAALKKLDTALNKVRTQASEFGSHLIVLQTRQDFTKQSILTLNAGADLLTLADTSEEGANLLALQTRQQLSTQALAMASQTDQAVLRLFG